MESSDRISGNEIEQLFDELKLKQLQREQAERQNWISRLKFVGDGIGGDSENGFDRSSPNDSQ